MPRSVLYQMFKRFKKTDSTVQLQHYVKQSIQMDKAQKSPKWLEIIYYTLLKRNPFFELNWLLLTDIGKLIFTVSPCILYHKVLFVPTYALVFK